MVNSFLYYPCSNGGTASPGGKSSGFLSNESNCPSPAPTMNSSFDLQAPDNNGPEVFTWGRIIKIGILVIVMILIAVSAKYKLIAVGLLLPCNESRPSACLLKVF